MRATCQKQARPKKKENQTRTQGTRTQGTKTHFAPYLVSSLPHEQERHNDSLPQ